MIIRYKEIKNIIKNTPAQVKNTHIHNYISCFVGFYHPSNANWSYQVHVIIFMGTPIKVVSCFGTIK